MRPQDLVIVVGAPMPRAAETGASDFRPSLSSAKPNIAALPGTAAAHDRRPN